MNVFDGENSTTSICWIPPLGACCLFEETNALTSSVKQHIKCLNRSCLSGQWGLRREWLTQSSCWVLKGIYKFSRQRRGKDIPWRRNKPYKGLWGESVWRGSQTNSLVHCVSTWQSSCLLSPYKKIWPIYSSCWGEALSILALHKMKTLFSGGYLLKGRQIIICLAA